MNILLLPCHSILEYDEYKLFLELGHNVFSFGGYLNPLNPHDPKRPPITNGKVNERFIRIAETSTKDNIHEEMIEWADVIIVHHIGRWIVNNWNKIKHKKVVWRTIGQSIEWNEKELEPYRREGLKIVRYSPMEKNIPSFIGEDAIIRFYKDENEFNGWVGNDKKVITFAQDVPHRRDFLNFNVFKQATEGLNRVLFGPDNREMESEVKVGGNLNYKEMKNQLKTSRVFFYTGTQPASYTLAFIEAFMTGIPIVSIGKEWGNKIYKLNLFEIENIIENGKDGFVSNDINQLKDYVKRLLEDDNLAFNISMNARKKAIELFGKEKIKKQWQDFFNLL